MSINSAIWLDNREEACLRWRSSIYYRFGDPEIVAGVENLFKMSQSRAAKSAALSPSGWVRYLLWPSVLYTAVHSGINCNQAYSSATQHLPDWAGKPETYAKLNSLIYSHGCAVIVNAAYNEIAATAEEGENDWTERLAKLVEDALDGDDRYVAEAVLMEATGYVDVGRLGAMRVLEEVGAIVAGLAAVDSAKFHSVRRSILDAMVELPDVPVEWIVAQLGLYEEVPDDPTPRGRK